MKILMIVLFLIGFQGLLMARGVDRSPAVEPFFEIESPYSHLKAPQGEVYAFNFQKVLRAPAQSTPLEIAESYNIGFSFSTLMLLFALFCLPGAVILTLHRGWLQKQQEQLQNHVDIIHKYSAEETSANEEPLPDNVTPFPSKKSKKTNDDDEEEYKKAS